MAGRKAGGATPPAEASGRSRAIVAPPIPAAALFWHGRLFTADDVPALAQAARPLAMLPDVDAARVAAELHDAFDAALRRAVLLDRTSVAGKQERAWWLRLGRQAEDLLRTLGCDPAAPVPPGVWHLIAAVQSASRCPVTELVPVERTIEKLVAAADGLPIQGRDLAAAHEAQCKGAAVSLIEQAPIVLGVIAKVAATAANDVTNGQGGRHTDVLAKELFVRLARVHQTMFGRMPKVRDGAGLRAGPSIAWAKEILRLAHDRIKMRNPPGDAAECLNGLLGLRGLDDDTLAEHLSRAAKCIRAATRKLAHARV